MAPPPADLWRSAAAACSMGPLARAELVLVPPQSGCGTVFSLAPPAAPGLHEERPRREGAGGLAEARAEIRQGDAEGLPARARIHEEGEGTGLEWRRRHH